MTQTKQSPSLFWLIPGFFYAGFIAYVSLMPSPPSVPGIPYLDKVQHCITYFLLMGYFGQVIQQRFHLPIYMGVILYGLLIEYLQLQTGYRFFEWADFAANSFGALLALLFIKNRYQGVLHAIEQKIFPPKLDEAQ